MAAICAGLVYNSPSEGYGFAEAVLPADPADPLVWQPLIPVGDFEHPDFGPFTVTYEDLAAMEGNFRAGLPVAFRLTMTGYTNCAAPGLSVGSRTCGFRTGGWKAG